MNVISYFLFIITYLLLITTCITIYCLFLLALLICCLLLLALLFVVYSYSHYYFWRAWAAGNHRELWRRSGTAATPMLTLIFLACAYCLHLHDYFLLQGIIENFGGVLGQLPTPMHGKPSMVKIVSDMDKGIFSEV